MKLTTIAMVVLALTAGCGKKDDATKASDKTADPAKDKGGDKDKAAPAGGLDEADEFIFKSSKDDLAAAKDKLAKGEDPSTSCVAATSYAEKLRDKKIADVEAHIKDLDKTCGYDIPVAIVEKEVVKAEEARKKDPKGVVSECFNAVYDMNMEELKKTAAADEKVKGLEARFLAACPKK